MTCLARSRVCHQGWYMKPVRHGFFWFVEKEVRRRCVPLDGTNTSCPRQCWTCSARLLDARGLTGGQTSACAPVETARWRRWSPVMERICKYCTVLGCRRGVRVIERGGAHGDVDCGKAISFACLAAGSRKMICPPSACHREALSVYCYGDPPKKKAAPPGLQTAAPRRSAKIPVDRAALGSYLTNW
jgi:hypothetical protein